MTKRVELHPDWPWTGKIRITPGVKVGETIYTPGQVAFAPDGSVVGVGDAAAQCLAVFDTRRAVPAPGGAAEGAGAQ